MYLLNPPGILRKQPQGGALLDKRHWLTKKNVTLAINFARPTLNSATGKRISLTGGGSGFVRRATPQGMGLYTPDDGWADFFVNQDWSGPNTIIALCRANSIDNPWGGLFSKHSAGASTQFAVGRDAFSNSLYGAVEDATALPFGASTIASLTDFHVLAFSHSGVAGTGMSYYLDGAHVGTSGALGAQGSGAGILGLGRSRDGLVAYDSDVDWLAFIRAAQVLTTRENAEIASNIWAPWQAPARRLWAYSAVTTITGTLAYTNADDSLAANGTTAVVGSLATTNANDTVSASGSPIVSGILATTNADDTVSASGSVGSAVTGTLAVTNANDSIAASGTTAVTGTLAQTNANDTIAASGSTTVVGAIAATNADDTIVASGTAGAGTVTGTLNVVNADDTLAAIGTTKILGSLAATNSNDTLSASGTVNNGITIEAALVTGIAPADKVKKPGIPNDAPAWLKTFLETVVGRRGNRIEVPAHRDLTFSATPTKAECEALYQYVNQVRTSVQDIITRLDS